MSELDEFMEYSYKSEMEEIYKRVKQFAIRSKDAWATNLYKVLKKKKSKGLFKLTKSQLRKAKMKNDLFNKDFMDLVVYGECKVVL